MDLSSTEKHLRRRHRKAKRFKVYCFVALGLAGLFLVLFFCNIAIKAFPAFHQAEVKVNVDYSEEAQNVPKRAVAEKYRNLISHSFFRQIPDRMDDNAELKGEQKTEWVVAASSVDQYLKHFQERYNSLRDWLIENKGKVEKRKAEIKKELKPIREKRNKLDIKLTRLEMQMNEEEFKTSSKVQKAREKRASLNEKLEAAKKGIVKKYNEKQERKRNIEAMVEGAENIEKIEQLARSGDLQMAFNKSFFFNGDSKMPEAAGIKAAAVGSFMVIGLTLLFTFPIGVLSAIFLEEFAPDNKFTQTIEVNINNLAAVPSILFGLLGLAVFINFFGVGRSTALAGGLTLALRTLPIIIIATRAALRAIPDSIRQGSLALGATHWQTVVHHVLPLSLPGILTGTIIGLAQAMGETAPLLIVGMVAFIPDVPSGISDPVTVMPAQIYTWSAESLRAYTELTAAAIMVLLAILVVFNGAAILLRNKFEMRW